MEITSDIKYIGVNDHQIDLFEGQYKVPNGMSYNSYIIIDDNIAIMDTVDQNFTDEWLTNIENELNGKIPNYLVIQHMEPDHSASIDKFMNKYENTTIVSSAKAFDMMNNYFKTQYENRQIIVKEGDKLPLGNHILHFVEAPMVHWPEVIVTYDSYSKVLFSADGFGKFGALDAEEEWCDEARRYYIGIVGKYGKQVQNLLKKATSLDIAIIAPLHGPILSDNLSYYLNLYNIWSSYEIEKDGVVVCYTSVYGHTKTAVDYLVEKLHEYSCPEIKVFDLARCDMSEAVSNAFAYSKLILATTTYNADIYPFMREFINNLTERNYKKRTIGLIENGSWAPIAAKTIQKMLSYQQDIKYVDPIISIISSLSDENNLQLDKLAREICIDYIARNPKSEDKLDMKSLFNIGYGLYVVTTNDGIKDNGLIVNTVVQLTDNPYRIMVSINKANYSCDIVLKTHKMNINCLSIEAPFKVFEQFGFKSGRDVNKFEGENVLRSENGLVFLSRYINSYFSLNVIQQADMGTHMMFICSVSEAVKVNNDDTMTYTYYQRNVKPKPETEGKKGFVCKVCGYIYEGDVLPDDYICPLCKHGASDFEPIQ